MIRCFDDRECFRLPCDVNVERTSRFGPSYVVLLRERSRRVVRYLTQTGRIAARHCRITVSSSVQTSQCVLTTYFGRSLFRCSFLLDSMGAKAAESLLFLCIYIYEKERACV